MRGGGLDYCVVVGCLFAMTRRGVFFNPFRVVLIFWVGNPGLYPGLFVFDPFRVVWVLDVVEGDEDGGAANTY